MKIIYLSKSDPAPNEEDRWVLIERSEDGQFFGTGFGFRDGEEKIYVSRPENDKSLCIALEAAKKWASVSGVEMIFVRDEVDLGV